LTDQPGASFGAILDFLKARERWDQSSVARASLGESDWKTPSAIRYAEPEIMNNRK
jgi:hypothetical protein